MIKTSSPRVLWDHCIELEALIRSLTSNTVYMTNGKRPETIMTGSNADISHIYEFGWYDWVMFRDNVPTFPDVKLTLGQYLGPATDVGSALTAKILNSLTPKYVPAGTKLVLFGRYVLNIYVGIV
jgi:hypothetical protein